MMGQEKVDLILKGSTLELKKAMLGENAPIVGAVALLGMSEDHILH